MFVIQACGFPVDLTFHAITIIPIYPRRAPPRTASGIHKEQPKAIILYSNSYIFVYFMDMFSLYSIM
jgi:hypothetical protein